MNNNKQTSRKTSVNVETKTDVWLPQSPNFLTTKDGKVMPVGELTMTQAEKIGEAIKQQFIRHVDHMGGTHK